MKIRRNFILYILRLRPVFEKFEIDFKKETKRIAKLRLKIIKVIRGRKMNWETIPLLNLLINFLTV